MKKMLLAFAVIATGMFLTTAKAGTSRGIDKETKKQLRKERRETRRSEWLHSVNVQTENQFHADFPKALNVSWTQGAFAEAAFDDGSIHKTAYYDMDDELVGTTNMIEYSQLPDKAQQYIAKKYPGYEYEKVILFDDNEANDTDMYLFNHAFDDEDTYFAVLSKDAKQIILKVTTDGNVSFFQDYK